MRLSWLVLLLVGGGWFVVDGYKSLMFLTMVVTEAIPPRIGSNGIILSSFLFDVWFVLG